MSLDKKVNVIVSVIDKFSKGTSDFESGMKTAAKAALAAEVALVTLSLAAGALAIKIGSELVKTASEFHDAIFNIGAVAASFGTTTDQISNILDSLVAKFPLTGKEAGAAMELIAQMGYGGAEGLALMSDAAITLSIATSSNLTTAAKATMATMNAFGMSISETERVINTFAAAAFSSAAGTEELREAMKYAAPVAALAGQSFESTVAAVSKLVDKGLEASSAGTTLRMALSQLGKGTDTTTAALAKYGVTLDMVNPEVHSLSEIIGAFNGQTIGAIDAMAIFGVRAASFALIVNEGTAAFDEYTDSITATTAAVDAANVKSQKWEVVMNNLGGTFDVFKKTIGEETVPLILDFVGRDENSGIRAIITNLMNIEKVSGKLSGPLVDAFNLIKNSVFGVVDSLDDGKEKTEGLYDVLSNIATLLGKNVEVLTIYGAAWGGLFMNTASDGELVKLVLFAINTALGAMAITVAGVHDVMAGLINLGQIGFAALQVANGEFISFLISGFAAVVKAADNLPFTDFSAQIKTLEGVAAGYKKTADEAFGNVKLIENWSDNVAAAIGKADQAISNINTSGAKTELESLDKTLKGLGEKETAIKLKMETANPDEILTLKKQLDEIAVERKTLVKVNVDELSLKSLTDKLGVIENEEKEIRLRLNSAKTTEEIDALKIKLSDLQKEKVITLSAAIDAKHIESIQKQVDKITAEQKQIVLKIASAETEAEVTALKKKFDELTNLKNIIVKTEVKNKEELVDLQLALNEMVAKENQIKLSLKDEGLTKEQISSLKKELEILTAEKRVVLTAMADKNSITAVRDLVNSEIKDISADITVGADEKEVLKIGKQIYEWVLGEWKPIAVKPVADEKSLKTLSERFAAQGIEMGSTFNKGIDDQIADIKLEIDTISAQAGLDIVSENLTRVSNEIRSLSERKNEIEIDILTGNNSQDLYDELQNINSEIGKLEVEKNILITADSGGANEKIADLNKELDKLNDKKYETAVEVKYDAAASAESLKKFKEVMVRDENGVFIQAVVELDEGEVISKAQDIGKKAKDKIEEESKFELSLKKEAFESNLKIVEDRIKFTQDMARDKLKFDVELKIANMEFQVNAFEAGTDRIRAEAERIIGVMDSLGGSIDAVASASASMFTAFAGTDFGADIQKKWMMQDIMEQQITLQEKLIDAQIELANAEKERMIAETKAIQSGQMRPLKVEISGDTSSWFNGLIKEMMAKIVVKAQSEAFSCFGSETA